MLIHLAVCFFGLAAATRCDACDRASVDFYRIGWIETRHRLQEYAGDQLAEKEQMLNDGSMGEP